MAAVHLMKTYCVLSLLYASETEIWSLINSSAHSVKAALNNAFGKIFNCCWWETLSRYWFIVKLACCLYKKDELSQRWPRDAPYIHVWCPEKLSPWVCPRLRMCVQNLKFVALPIPEIIPGTQKIWAVPTLPFLQNFEWAFVRMHPVCTSQIRSP